MQNAKRHLTAPRVNVLGSAKATTLGGPGLVEEVIHWIETTLIDA